MSGVTPSLEQALVLSRALLESAEHGDLPALTELDARRLQLLESFRLLSAAISAADRAVLRQIEELNDRAIGAMEHHRRSKGRALDMAAVGRRALAAYSTTQSTSPGG